MKKVYLVIKGVSNGQGFDDVPYCVCRFKDDAEQICRHIFGFVEELDFYEGEQK